MADWKAFMEGWNSAILAKKESPDVILPPDLVAKGWFGNPGASDEQIESLERRLGTPLPPSYRDFLKVTNGWNGKLTHSINKLWSTDDVDWFSKRNQEWIDAWMLGASWMGETPEVSDEDYFVYGDDQDCVNLRVSYLPHTLEISDTGDSAIFLLNPKVKTDDGEWEAWFFASWLPGANRYRSFWDLMQAEYRLFMES